MATKTKEPKAKKECPLNADEFMEGASDITVRFGDQTLIGTPKTFGSGSFGWYVTGKVSIKVGDVNIPCQVGANVVAVGSKPVE